MRRFIVIAALFFGSMVALAQQSMLGVGYNGSAFSDFASSFTGAPGQSAPPVIIYGYNATGLQWSQYQSGITATGTAGQTCTLTSFNNSSTATATVALTGVNTIALSTPLNITAQGSGATAAPTTATAGNGTATCSGTATLKSGIGAYGPILVDGSGNIVAGGFPAGASLPATCTSSPAMQVYGLVTTGTTAPYYCSTTNNWTAFGSGGGGGSNPVGGLYAIQYYATSSTLGGSANATVDASGNLYVAGAASFGSAGTPLLADTVCQPAAGLATTYPPASYAPVSVGGGKYKYYFVQVCDAASATDCSVGGGTTLNSCVSTGSAWVPSVAIGGGSVTSVAMTVPSWLTVTGSPITGAGTLAVTGTSETANYFLAAPNGSAGAMTPRAIVSADIPTLNQNTSGTAAGLSTTLAVASGGTGTGSTLTGLVRGNASAMTASELSGDCVTSGSNSVSCAHTYATLTDSASVTWTTTGAISNAILTGVHTTTTRALNLSGLANGDYGTLVFKQDSTGSANITGGTGCTWYVAGTTGYTATSTFFASAPAANAVDIITWTYDGTNCYANVH